jgi:hypothetical protein
VANILTAEEAARVVAVDPADDKLADVLPQVDAYIQHATGRDWTQDTEIRPEAKAAARLQLALIYDLMAMQPSQIASLRAGLVSSLAQLETIASCLQAIENINTAAYVADMEIYIASGKLGLNLIDYNRMRPNAQRSAAQAMLDNRPLGGYADLSAIQAALDAAVKAGT